MFFGKKKLIARNIYSCPKDWDKLEGDAQVRTCGTCNHHVFNLTGLSEDEVIQFVIAHDGKICALAHTDRQGLVVNGECGAEVQRTLGRIAVIAKSEQQILAEKIALAEKRVALLTRLAELLSRKPS